VSSDKEILPLWRRSDADPNEGHLTEALQTELASHHLERASFDAGEQNAHVFEARTQL